MSTALPAGAAQAAPKAAAATAGTRAITVPDVINVDRGDRRFPDLVRGNNQRWVANPDRVVLVTNPHQAARVVQETVSAGKRFTVRSGGHCYEDFVYSKDVQVVIDLSNMNKVGFDPAMDAFEVQAGASNFDVYETLYKLYGVSIPAGTCGTVGAGGHIMGGGYGLLSRLHGLTVDYLHAVEVVTVDTNGNATARIARRSDAFPKPGDPTPDPKLGHLYWAHTGGGGGNFGLLTRYWLRIPDATGGPANLLPKPPSEVFVQALAWKWDKITQTDFVQLVANFGTWHEKNSASNSPYNSLCGLLKLNNRAHGEIGLLTQMSADEPNARELLAAYQAEMSKGIGVAPTAMTLPMGEHAALPGFKEPRRLPWFHATDALSGGTAGKYGKYKSSYSPKGFSEFQIRAMYTHLTNGYDNGDALLQIDSYGGRINDVAADATAVPQRSSVLKSQFQTYWLQPGEEARHVKWIRDFYEAVYAQTGGVPVPNEFNDGCYVNYPDVDLGDPARNTSTTTWQTLYYKNNYRRLQLAKALWDPNNHFRHAQSITGKA
ncbi:oxidoreductase [Streptomyces clavuligerus]|nr:oxidoreductase [Streptomyces clavuligerus]